MSASTHAGATQLWLENPECKWSIALEGLTQQEHNLIYDRLIKKTYKPRSMIFHIGEAPDALLIVESGRIKMFHSREFGEIFTIAIWPAGYTVGLLSTLLNQTRLVTVESVESTVILELPRKDLFELMRTIPSFAVNIARLTASMARESLEIASPLVLDSAAARLSNVLSKVAVLESEDSSNKAAVVRGLSQDDLASMVGVSRTWLTIILSKLEEKKLIWRKRLEIGIYDLDKLNEFCRVLDNKDREG